MGCFYTGRNFRRWVNLRFKLGESDKDTPASRLSGIRREEPFECLGYLKLPNSTKSERLYVESYARLMVERSKKFTQQGNDHFVCKNETANKDGVASLFSTLALGYAMDACKMMGIEYEVGTKTYKRR